MRKNKKVIIICNMRTRQQKETLNMQHSIRTQTKEIVKIMQHILQTQTAEKKYTLKKKNMQHILQTTTKRAPQQEMQHILQTKNKREKTTDKVVDWLGFRMYVLKVSQSKYRAGGEQMREKSDHMSTTGKTARKITRREVRGKGRKTTGGK